MMCDGFALALKRGKKVLRPFNAPVRFTSSTHSHSAPGDLLHRQFVERRPGGAHARVVAEDADAPEVLLDLSRRALPGGSVADVKHQREDAVAEIALGLVMGKRKRFLVNVRNGNARAAPQQRAREAQSQALCTAGNDSDLVGDVFDLNCPSFGGSRRRSALYARQRQT